MKPSTAEHLRVDGIRAIAGFEAFKGIVVLVAGFGLLSLLHRDLEAIAERLVRLSHLNPARHYPRIFIEAASRTSDARLKTLAALALLYSTIRFIEAYGLWRTRVWAEWFAIISGSLYVPMELYEIFKKPTPLRFLVLVSNLVIVLYLIYIRIQSHKGKSSDVDGQRLVKEGTTASNTRSG